MRTPVQQAAIDQSHIAASIAASAFADAQGEVWTAHADIIEFGRPDMHIDRAIALLSVALDHLQRMRDAIVLYGSESTGEE